jgi:hypothetical protein
MRQTVEVDVLTTSEATVVEVKGGTYLQTNPELVAQGFAKKHPKDDHDAEIGHSLAMARALKALAESYEKRAWERINNPIETRTFELTGYVTGINSIDSDSMSDYEWDDLRAFKFQSTP